MTAVQAEETVKHYEAAEVKDTAQAVRVLKEKVTAIDTLIAKEKLEISDMESVHEVSYSLATAVDFLRLKQTKEQEAVLDKCDEAVQAIHFASEKHEEAKLREWFPILKTSSDQVATIF
jgi:hypothetical protein